MEEDAGGFLGVADFEVVVQAERDGFGSERGEGLQGRLGWALEGSGADQDVVVGVGLEHDFGVAEEGKRADIEAVALQDGADEDAEVGGLVDDEDTRAALFGQSLGGTLAGEGEDGFLFGGENLEGAAEHGELEAAW